MKYQISLSTEYGKQKKLLLARKMIAIITVHPWMDSVLNEIDNKTMFMN